MLKKIMKFFKNGEKGFTLIELLVVIAILGVLAAVAVPNVMNLLSAGDESAAKANAAAIQTAADAYATVHGGTYPNSNDQLLTQLRALPTKGTYTITNGTVAVTSFTGNGTITY
jgi:prepilin-type N-terminal cleavage/methylation domain-containing protein